MPNQEAETLKRRAWEFLAAAEDDLRAGRTDLAAFHSEQAAQLALKYVLAKEIGYYPHTHSLKALFEAVLNPPLLACEDFTQFVFCLC